jgi:hypothetical protein
MFWLYAALSSAGILEPVICSCVAAEWIGYRLQELVGNDRLLFLSGIRSFTLLLLLKPQRSNQFALETEQRHKQTDCIYHYQPAAEPRNGYSISGKFPCNVIN